VQLFKGAGGSTQIARNLLNFTMNSVWDIMIPAACNDGVTSSPASQPWTPTTVGLPCGSDNVADPRLTISYACSDGPVTKAVVWNRRAGAASSWNSMIEDRAGHVCHEMYGMRVLCPNYM
jgi:hypothetical protein